ncbi:MAG: hypothetical protein Q9185_000919 [Variospora sp. 1 TL-2023]
MEDDDNDHPRTRDSSSPTLSDSSSIDIILTPPSSPSPSTSYTTTTPIRYHHSATKPNNNNNNHHHHHPSSSPWPSTPALSALLDHPEIPPRYQNPPGRAREYLKRRIRLRQRLGGSAALARYDAVRLRRRLEEKRRKESMARLVKDACMKRELKRAMKTKISPKFFCRIRVAEEEEEEEEKKNTGTEDDERSRLALLASDEEEDTSKTTERAADCDAFAGQIVIQDHLAAITQALSEHCKDGPRRKEPGRHAFYVDAAVSKKHDLTGIGVTFKTHRQNWASPWTARGYQINKTLKQTEAEMWAVWQAMEMGDGIAQRIGDEARELQKLGVNIQLHWVPGHEKIPGNELADRMAKQATFYPPCSTD